MTSAGTNAESDTESTILTEPDTKETNFLYAFNRASVCIFLI